MGEWLRELVLPTEALKRVQRFVRERPEHREVEAMRARLDAKRRTALESKIEGDITKEHWREIREIIDAQLPTLPLHPVEPTADEVQLIANIGELWDRASRSERQGLAEQVFEKASPCSRARACRAHAAPRSSLDAVRPGRDLRRPTGVRAAHRALPPN